ncbi:MAG: pseudouridine synthase [Candidatus Berkelbacteria bacterium]|nr:pseudouridine synthase [Candidatus Berkelbacteria bacterium]
MLIRLNKFLAESGVCSRRKADEEILAGRVSVNGIVVKAMGLKINSGTDLVEFEGQTIKQIDKLIYYAVYKPLGVVSTASDELNRETVIDLVPKTPRVYPVGRLDANSEGLMILTNDGDFAQRLTHPSFEHEKEYEVRVKRSIKSKVCLSARQVKSSDEIKYKFEKGFEIDSVWMKADLVSDFKDFKDYLDFRLVLHTGYNRQIRRMCAKIGLEVIKLTRIRIGKLTLSDLRLSASQFVQISPNQVI